MSPVRRVNRLTGHTKSIVNLNLLFYGVKYLYVCSDISYYFNKLLFACPLFNLQLDIFIISMYRKTLHIFFSEQKQRTAFLPFPSSFILNFFILILGNPYNEFNILSPVDLCSFGIDS